ncbi:MAG: hypothetical protein OKBPIBMD_01271 [Chlorobi bacterium]|nr:MAG: hypothetical protein UZ06_CHB003000362 [Chlorobi bacterium OLB6]MBV6463823.1 hypothetical protein [Chlorobiota bacterium]
MAQSLECSKGLSVLLGRNKHSAIPGCIRQRCPGVAERVSGATRTMKMNQRLGTNRVQSDFLCRISKGNTGV